MSVAHSCSQTKSWDTEIRDGGRCCRDDTTQLPESDSDALGEAESKCELRVAEIPRRRAQRSAQMELPKIALRKEKPKGFSLVQKPLMSISDIFTISIRLQWHHENMFDSHGGDAA